jgi:ABC-2 type transport system permease protein
MTTDTAVEAPRRPQEDAGAGADAAIARRAFRQTWISATVLAVVFGASVASTALAYVSSFPTEASRAALAATAGSDTSLAVLLGTTAHVGTVGGYTVYKIFVFLTTIGAIWGLLAATRLLRGEEDTGRWHLVLAGATRAGRATAATLTALFVAVFVIFAGTSLLAMLAGRSPDVGFGAGESVLYGLSIALAPAVFVAVGAVTSQLGSTRRLATSLAMVVFGVAFVLRMIADTGPGTQWLLWFTPFGWTELMQPFTDNNVWPLLPAVVVTVVLAWAAIALASRRDTGAGLMRSRDVTAPRPFGLRSAFGLAARLELPVLVAWCVGAVAAGFALGTIALLTTTSAPPSVTDTLQKFGVEGGSYARQYLGVAFLLVAAVVALLPASQLGAACAEETSGRLVHVLAQPTRRRAWIGGRLALTAAAVVATGVLAGLAAWLGATSQGVELDIVPMLVAGVNIIPTALVALGIGAVVLAFAPRAAAGAVYVVVIASLLIELLTPMFTGATWLDHVSLLHYMALAPAQDPDVVTMVTVTAIGIALCLLATAIFDRRDVRQR